LRVILQREPSRRPGAKAALKHPWLTKASTTSRASLLSLQTMLNSAHGVFGPTEAVGLADPDELDAYLQMQQDFHQGGEPNVVESSKVSSSQSMFGIVPRSHAPGTITTQRNT